MDAWASELLGFEERFESAPNGSDFIIALGSGEPFGNEAVAQFRVSGASIEPPIHQDLIRAPARACKIRDLAASNFNMQELISVERHTPGRRFVAL